MIEGVPSPLVDEHVSHHVGRAKLVAAIGEGFPHQAQNDRLGLRAGNAQQVADLGVDIRRIALFPSDDDFIRKA